MIEVDDADDFIVRSHENLSSVMMRAVCAKL